MLSYDNNQLQLAHKFESVKTTSGKTPRDCACQNDNQNCDSCQVG